MDVKFHKLCENAVLPERATAGSAGFDLRATEDFTVEPGVPCLVPTGLRMEMPPTLEAQVRSRSGLAAKYGVFVLNSPGTIDSDYRGEVKVILATHRPFVYVGKAGERIAQLVFANVVVPEIVEDDLDETDRGSGGFGSTGSK